MRKQSSAGLLRDFKKAILRVNSSEDPHNEEQDDTFQEHHDTELFEHSLLMSIYQGFLFLVPSNLSPMDRSTISKRCRDLIAFESVV